MHGSVDAVNVMAAYQPVVLTCVHCGGRIERESLSSQVHKFTINASNIRTLKADYRKCISCGQRVVVFL